MLRGLFCVREKGDGRGVRNNIDKTYKLCYISFGIIDNSVIKCKVKRGRALRRSIPAFRCGGMKCLSGAAGEGAQIKRKVEYYV